MAKSSKINGILNVIKRCCHILFPLLTFPYLTRVLGPENLGKFSFSDSLINYFVLGAMLGVDSYAVREGARLRDDRTKLSKFISEIFGINIVSCVFACLCLFLVVNCISSIKEYKFLLYILSVMIPATVLGRDYINTIYEDFLYITVRYIIIQILGLLAIFLFVKESDDYVLYTAIFSFTYSAGYIYNVYYTRKRVPYAISFVNWKKHLIPILILFFGQIATTVYIQSDITMIGLMKDDVSVGVYTMSSKTYLLTKSIINALIIVMVPRIVYYLGKKDFDNYNHFTQKLADYLFYILIPIVVFLFIEAKNIILLLAGPDYAEGTIALQLLSISLIPAVFAGYLCNAIIIPNRKEKDFLYITVIAAIVNVLMNLLLIPLFGINGVAISTIVAECIVLILSYKRTRDCLKISIDKFQYMHIILVSSLIFVVSALCNILPLHNWLQLLIAGVVSIAVYYIYLSFIKNPLVLDINGFVYKVVKNRKHE